MCTFSRILLILFVTLIFVHMHSSSVDLLFFYCAFYFPLFLWILPYFRFFSVRAGRAYTPPNGLQLTLSSAIAPYMGSRGRERGGGEGGGSEGGRGRRGKINKTQGVLTRSDTLVMKNLGQWFLTIITPFISVCLFTCLFHNLFMYLIVYSTMNNVLMQVMFHFLFFIFCFLFFIFYLLILT